MPSLQIRELPDYLYNKLVEEAARDHRSLSQEAIVILEKGFGIVESSQSRRKKIIENWKSNSPSFSKKLSDPVSYIREDRDR